MMRRTRVAFALLLAAQAAHSAEEFVAKLYDVFPPARFVSSLFSDDLQAGFVVANVLLIAVGVWCWAIPIGRNWPSAVALSWFWAAFEIINGTVHSILAVGRQAYFPGALTAPLLIASGAWLAMSLVAGAGDQVSAT
jgi:Protein of unknown function with HXXEE motif